jgi:hypothetical protein
LGPFGPLIELGIAERDVEGAMHHELFEDLERGAGIEELGGVNTGRNFLKITD